MNKPCQAIVLATLLTGCRGIPATDPGTAREELEVLVEVDPPVLALLKHEDDVAAIETVVSDAVFALADVGMRFYPVPASSYAEGDVHPPYLLTVRIQDVGATFGDRTVLTSHDGELPERDFDNIRCSAVATVMKRRDSGPALIVGKTMGHGATAVQEAAAALSSMREFELTSPDPYGKRSRFRSEDLDTTIREAVTSALTALVEPIDRELSVE